MARAPIDPGSFRVPLALQKPGQASDGMGGFAEGWEDVATVMAAVEPVSARPRYGADQPLAETTHRVTLRRMDSLERGMRFKWAARIFAILTVRDPDETGRYLVCEVKETDA